MLGIVYLDHSRSIYLGFMEDMFGNFNPDPSRGCGPLTQRWTKWLQLSRAPYPFLLGNLKLPTLGISHSILCIVLKNGLLFPVYFNVNDETLLVLRV